MKTLTKVVSLALAPAVVALFVSPAGADWSGGYNQQWHGDGRTFQQLDCGRWVEIHCGRVVFTFDQEGISTRGKWVLLHDPSRGVRVMLDGKTCSVQVAPGGLYDVYYRGGWKHFNRRPPGYLPPGPPVTRPPVLEP